MRVALLTSAIVLVGALIALWFFTTYERAVTEIPASYQGEARLNHFLAAEMLLRELEYEADSRASLTPSVWLPGLYDTLVVRLSATFSAPDELGLLTTWVASGGHLVLLAPEQSTEATDSALGTLGVQLIEIEFETEPDARERVLTAKQADEAGAIAYTVDRGGVWQNLAITDGALDGVTLSDEHGIVAARRPWGSGFVTVIAGASQFQNPQLAELDHARLLLDVVAGYVEPGMVWFVYDAWFPPLWRLIWGNFPYVVAGAAMTILLWLWSVMARFGPAIAPVAPARRSIVEHVEAAGQFQWRNHGAGALIQSSTDAVLRRAESKHPGIARLGLDEQATLLAEMTGQHVQTIRAALEPRDLKGQREFTQMIHALQEIRNEL